MPWGVDREVVVALVELAAAVLLVMVAMVGCTEGLVEKEGSITQTQREIFFTVILVQEVVVLSVLSGVMAEAIRIT
jgi:hypothetical protein